LISEEGLESILPYSFYDNMGKIHVKQRDTEAYLRNMQTPSGKIELSSESLKAIGLPALPTHMPLVEEPNYPLLFVSAPNHNFMNSTFSNNEKHIKLEKAPNYLSI